MKKTILTAVIAVAGLTAMNISAHAAETKTPVFSSPDGYYRQYISEHRLAYYVDAETQLCFAGQGGLSGQPGVNGLSPTLTVIPCANLKKRDEWKTIITW